MNKSEAIEILEEIKAAEHPYSKAYLEALDMAIKALKADAIPINWLERLKFNAWRHMNGTRERIIGEVISEWRKEE